MSRTRHRRSSTQPQTHQQQPKATLTRGGGYSPSAWDYHPVGETHNPGWATWLNSYEGYQKERKRRRDRRIMKVAGRRSARRQFKKGAHASSE